MSSSSQLPPCCPPGSWPQLLRKKDELDTDFTRKGTVTSVKTSLNTDLPIYFVEPAQENKKNAGIVVIPDIYSVRVFDETCNSGDRIGLICDALAEQGGYSVALARVFRDEPFDKAVMTEMKDYIGTDIFEASGTEAWLKKFGYQHVGPDIVAAAAFLREKLGNDAPLGVVGFCYGNWAFCKASASGDVAFTYGVACHPSTLLETFVYGGDEVELLQNLKMPVTFLAAGNDSEAYHEGKAGRQAVEAKGGSVIDFPDMAHGWVSRGDASDEAVKQGIDKALKVMFEVFEEKLK